MTGFVGIDPVGLLGLADTADQYSQRIRLVRANTARLLDGLAGSVAVDRRLSGVENGLAEWADNLRWRGSVIEQTQSLGSARGAVGPSGYWLAAFAATAVFDLDSWETTFKSWQAEDPLRQLHGASPSEVAAALEDLDIEMQVALARGNPEFVGGLDGAPSAMRYLANRVLIAREVMRLEATLDQLRLRSLPRSPSGLVVAELEARLGEYQSWLAEDRQILLFDPDGDGRVVEVFGDLDAATAVAVVVPGMANDLTNFSAKDGGFRMNAANLFSASSGRDVATIAWLGYDTPDGADAVSRACATSAAPDLVKFLTGIDPNGDRTVTVVAHSYGSVLAGIAAAGGIGADNVVFVGSPGTTLDHAGEAVLRPGGTVWSALADGDPIGLGVDPLASYRWWWGLSPLVPAVTLLESLRQRDVLWHGTNPVSDEFGANRISTEGSSGHSAYFEAGTLENLAAILEGRYSSVELAD